MRKKAIRSVPFVVLLLPCSTVAAATEMLVGKLLGTIGDQPKGTSYDMVPGIPDDAREWIESRSAPASATRAICPMFIVNARVDKLTPADKCVDFYASLLRAGVNAELHILSKGSHGFGLGDGQDESTALWPTSLVAWLHDCGIVED